MSMSVPIQICFQGGGGFYNYYFGIACYIQENYNLDEIIFSGVSAGSWPALFLAAKINIRENYFKLNEKIIKDTSKKKILKTPFRWNKCIERQCKKYFDESLLDHIDSNLFVSLTEKHKFLKFRNVLIDNFNSKDELIDTCSASTHIIVYNNVGLFKKIKKKKYLDGGFSKTYPFPYGKKLSNTISINTNWYSEKFLKKIRNFPPQLNLKRCEYLFYKGYKDAANNNSHFSLLTKLS